MTSNADLFVSNTFTKPHFSLFASRTTQLAVDENRPRIDEFNSHINRGLESLSKEKLIILVKDVRQAYPIADKKIKIRLTEWGVDLNSASIGAPVMTSSILYSQIGTTQEGQVGTGTQVSLGSSEAAGSTEQKFQLLKQKYSIVTSELNTLEELFKSKVIVEKSFKTTILRSIYTLHSEAIEIGRAHV